MLNKRMQEKLRHRIAVDISACKRTPDGFYILERFQDGMDYCDAVVECWIWSIGEDLETGEILASTDSTFYLNPKYKCLFLR